MDYFPTTEMDIYDKDNNNDWEVLIKGLCDTTKEINNNR